MCEAKRKVTVIYCCDGDLDLYRATYQFAVNNYGTMIIPPEFKRGKTIVALCDGEVEILNRIGDKLICDF